MRWLVALLLAASCGGKISGSTPDANPGDICPSPCPSDQVCRYRTCVPAPGPCATDAACLGDSYCDETRGECLPWGVGPGGTASPACVRASVPGVFFPGVQCEWLGPPAGDSYPNHKNVLGTPMVADFGLGGPELAR